jgi:hypothetical protein
MELSGQLYVRVAFPLWKASSNDRIDGQYAEWVTETV